MNPAVPDVGGVEDNTGQQLRAALQALMVPRVQQPPPPVETETPPAPRRSNVRLPVRSLDGSFSHSLYDLPRPPAKVRAMSPRSITGSPADLIKAAFVSAVARSAVSEKTAGIYDKLIGWGSLLASKFAPAAQRVQSAAQASKPMWNIAGRALPGAIGGGFQGYQAGEATGVGGTTGAVLGAGLGGLTTGVSNRWLASKGLSGVARPFRSSLIGSGAGGAVDSAASAAGYDTGSGFMNAGAGLGFGSGALASLGRSRFMSGGAAQAARNWGSGVSRGLGQFNSGVGAGWNAPFKGMANAWQRARGVVPAVTEAAAPLSHATMAGKLMGMGTAGMMGLGLGAKMIGNRIGEAVDSKAIELARAAGEVTPYLGQQLGANAGQAAVDQASVAAPRALAHAPMNLVNYLLGRGNYAQQPGLMPVGTGATATAPDLSALQSLSQRLNAGPSAFQPRDEMAYAQQFAGG